MCVGNTASRPGSPRPGIVHQRNILEKTKRAKGKGKTTEEPKPPEQTSKEAPEKEPTEEKSKTD